MEWSEWYSLTIEALAKHEAKNSGVYRIALRDAEVQYPNGPSPVIFIGDAPIRRLTERLKDHIRGWGNQGVYRYFLKGDTLIWSNLITGDLTYTSKRALDDFKAAHGAYPECNGNTSEFEEKGGS